MTTEAAKTRRAVRASIAVALLMVAQLVASRALRDGFFLSNFDPSALPQMMMASAVFSLAALLGSSRLLRNIAPARSLPPLLLASAGLFALEWALSWQAPRVAAVVLYLHVMSVGAMSISGFWSVVSERLDPFTAKREMARIGGGASFGGVIGGVATWQAAGIVDVPTMILVLGGLSVLCALGVVQIGTGDQPHLSDDETPNSVLEIFRSTPYLQQLVLLVALGAFCQASYDYVFKAHAAAHFGSGAELVSFFALFYMSLSIATFVVQNGLAARSLQLFGLSFNVGTMPGSGALLGVLAFLAPGFPMAIAMRAGIGVTENSLFRSGYELLFNPILPEKKRATKSLIDVGGDKLGTAAGAACAFIVLALVPGLAFPVMTLAGIVASLMGLVVARRLHHGYVSSLAESLRAGSIQVDEVPIVDATTQIALAEIAEVRRGLDDPLRAHDAASTTDEGAFVASESALRVLRGHRERFARGDLATRTAETQSPYRPPEPPPIEGEALDSITSAIADLRSDDPARATRALIENSPLMPELVHHVIALLDREALSQRAFESLRRVAPANTGVLLDAVLHSGHSLVVRRQICEILGRLPTQRCANGLVALLDDDDFELRFRAATSLLEIHHQNLALRISRERIFEVAEAEALACRRRWISRVSLDPRISEIPALESLEGRRVIHGTIVVWTLLLCVLDREPLSLAIRALAHDADAHRGTGLEYLENVLPARLLAALRPLLADSRLSAATNRSRSSVLGDLMRDRRDDAVDLASLRRHVDALRA